MPNVDVHKLCSSGSSYGSVITIGSYVHMVLFVLEGYLFYNCMSQKQPRWIRVLAIVMMTNDIVISFAVTFAVWLACVDPQDGPPLVIRWNMPATIITIALSSFGAHFYLINRIYNMSKNLPLMIFLGISAIAQAALQLSTASLLFISPKHLVMKAVPCHIPPTVAAWSSGFALDVVIAIVGLRLLLQYDSVFMSTKSVIRKFMLLAVVSGGLTAVWGAALVALLVKGNYAHSFFAINLGKIYGITVFANLSIIQGMQQQTTVLLGTRDNISQWFARHPSSMHASGEGKKV